MAPAPRPSADAGNHRPDAEDLKAANERPSRTGTATPMRRPRWAKPASRTSSTGRHEGEVHGHEGAATKAMKRRRRTTRRPRVEARRPAEPIFRPSSAPRSRRLPQHRDPDTCSTCRWMCARAFPTACTSIRCHRSVVIYPEWRGYDYVLVGDQVLDRRSAQPRDRRDPRCRKRRVANRHTAGNPPGRFAMHMKYHEFRSGG